MSAWIKCSERLPDNGRSVLVCYTNSLGNLRRVRAKWIKAKTDEATGDDASDLGEYDEEADVYWTPEGWYEVVDNWEDYRFISIHEGEPTHWMPMPDGPKETLT